MPKAIITVGISASGKTTWTKKHCLETGAINLNRDDLRFAVTGHDDWSTYKFNRDTEDLITCLQTVMAEEAINHKKDVVISDTNINRKTCYGWCDFFRASGYDVELKFFDVDVETCIARDASRPRSVGEDVIRKQFENYQKIKEQ